MAASLAENLELFKGEPTSLSSVHTASVDVMIRPSPALQDSRSKEIFDVVAFVRCRRLKPRSWRSTTYQPSYQGLFSAVTPFENLLFRAQMSFD